MGYSYASDECSVRPGVSVASGRTIPLAENAELRSCEVLKNKKLKNRCLKFARMAKAKLVHAIDVHYMDPPNHSPATCQPPSTSFKEIGDPIRYAKMR